jgi:hypothetical protein
VFDEKRDGREVLEQRAKWRAGNKDDEDDYE